MVRLSELVKKSKKGDVKGRDTVRIKVNEIRKVLQNPSDIKKIYEDSIRQIEKIMKDLQKDKKADGKIIMNLAETIVEKLHIKHEVFLSLVNDYNLYKHESEFMYIHSLNVAILSVNLGISLGYNKKELIDLCASALVHDIGMFNTSQEIITKPGRLTFEEFEQVKQHPYNGLELLKKITDMPPIASEVIIQHHEKFNGKGYPEGKKGKEISKYAQIVGIAEVYEALTHVRPYRNNRIIPFEAVKIIVLEENDSFYPELLKAFLNYVTFYPIGSYVKLNSDEIGKVVSVNKKIPLHPVIEIIQNSDGSPVEEKRQIDLAKSPFLYIEKALDENESLAE